MVPYGGLGWWFKFMIYIGSRRSHFLLLQVLFLLSHFQFESVGFQYFKTLFQVASFLLFNFHFVPEKTNPNHHKLSLVAFASLHEINKCRALNVNYGMGDFSNPVLFHLEMCWFRLSCSCFWMQVSNASQPKAMTLPLSVGTRVISAAWHASPAPSLPAMTGSCSGSPKRCTEQSRWGKRWSRRRPASIVKDMLDGDPSSCTLFVWSNLKSQTLWARNSSCHHQNLLFLKPEL